MLEVLVILAFFGYIYYLRNYADLRTVTEKEFDALSEGIKLYNKGQIEDAFQYFDRRIQEKPKLAPAYLYRGLCFKSNGKFELAANDFRTGLSYDHSVYQFHYELASLYFKANDTDAALASINRAIDLAEGSSAEIFHLRGKIYQLLAQPEKATTDFETAEAIRDNTIDRPAIQQKKAPFLDRRLIASMILVLFNTALCVYVIQQAEGVHFPYLVAVGAAISIGFAEPRKGWILAIMQSLLIFIGFTFIANASNPDGPTELQSFSLYGSILLTFAASFLGGFLKRAFSMK